MKARPMYAIAIFAACAFAAVTLFNCRTVDGAVNGPTDPGVRAGAPGAGGPLGHLTSDEAAFFQNGSSRFGEVEVVAGGANNGLGPRFNGNQCQLCHVQPAVGGSSPAQSPLIPLATL